MPKQKQPPTLDQQAALMRDRRYREWEQQRSIRSWMHETVCLSNDAAIEKLDDWRNYVFWVRLYGVLHDLRVHWKKVIDKRRASGLDPKRFEELVAAIDQAKAALSDEQLLCLEWRRHWVGHPILNDFRVTEKNQEILDTRKSSLLNGRMISKDRCCLSRRSTARVPRSIVSRPGRSLGLGARIGRGDRLTESERPDCGA